METRSVRNSGDHRRKSNRASTLGDRPQEWRSCEDSDEEVDWNGGSNHPKKFQPGPHRRSTMQPSRQATYPQIPDDIPSHYYSGAGQFNPFFGQALANNIAEHVKSTMRSSMMMHTVGDNEYESEYVVFYMLIRADD